MKKLPSHLERYVQAIAASKLTIYDPIKIGDTTLWIPTPELEEILDLQLQGLSLEGLPLRTRSKIIKETVCKVLGYPVPRTFKKTQPRFLGQQFDTYGQKANNLQIWNEELSPTRRYVILKINEQDAVEKVKVVTGDDLSKLDTTGTLTQKYQARLITGDSPHELVSTADTIALRQFLPVEGPCPIAGASPVDHPNPACLIPIDQIFEHLKTLVGRSFPDSGFDQERNRGAKLHELICKKLGYFSYQDDGRFPDIRHQLLEVKLQTSPTIDLGLVCPDSTSPLDVPNFNGYQLLHRDVRYALFYATTDGALVTLTHFYLTTGEMFFSRFQQFQGKVLNKKIQIPLPSSFFTVDSKGLPN